VIDLIRERGFNGGQVGPMAVAGKLNAVGKHAFQIVGERKGGVCNASAEQSAND
jgi:hypothetical protein